MQRSELTLTLTVKKLRHNTATMIQWGKGSMSLLLKRSHTYVIKNGEIELVLAPLEASPPTDWHSQCQKHYAQCWNRKGIFDPIQLRTL